MPTYGITPAGFQVKPLAAILADYQASWLANVDPTADLSPTTPEGQILGIVSNNDAELWELAQAAWNAYNREDVEGAGLDNLGDISGDPREGPSFTQVFVTLTISAGSAPYAPGTLVANVSGDPSLTFSNPGAVTAGMISGGTATVLFQATTIGATPTINPGTLTQITTPVTGWTGVTNPAFQSQLGSNEELDNAYAVRQVAQIGTEGACTQPATVAALIALAAAQSPPIEGFQCQVVENGTSAPVIFGSLTLPPHTYTPIVYDPTGTLTSQQIGQVIWENQPAGIESFGTTAVSIVDPLLGPQEVFYITPTSRPLFISTTIVVNPNFVPSTVAANVVSALVAAAVAVTPPNGLPPNGQLGPGQDVIGPQLIAVIMGVAGVYDLQLLVFDFHALPTQFAPLIVDPTQIATLTAANILVFMGTPP